MTESPAPDRAFADAMTTVLRECIERSGDTFLDPGGALLETLASVDAGLASRPIAPGAATIAAHVRHIIDSIEFAIAFLTGEPPDDPPGDDASAELIVDADAWTALRDDLGRTYDLLMMVASDPDTWSDPATFAAGVSIVAHTSVHVGEIRQALGTLRPEPA